MAIADERLKKFFSTQKIGAFDALKKNNPPLLKDSEQAIILHNDSKDYSCTSISEHKQTVSNSLASEQQPVSIPIASSELMVSNSLANKQQPVSIPIANPLANEDDNEIDWNVFSTKEQSLLKIIFEQCSSNCSLISPAISTEEIRKALNISPERVRNLIFRVVKKGGIKVKQHKSGQNAFRKFELSKNLYQAIIDEQNNNAKKAQTSLANPLANSIYSSSNNIINNTTIGLPLEWGNINIVPLKGIGFSITQLKQLINKNVPDIVQESIYHFAYALEHNEKYKNHQNPLNVIMGVLIKGSAWFENNYKSLQEIAQEQLLEQKKIKKEKMKSLEDKAYEFALSDWKEQLTDDEYNNIIQIRNKATNLIPSHVRVSMYFKDNIWPLKKKEYLVNSDHVDIQDKL